MKNRKTYYEVTALVFLIIAVLHAVRALYGWEANIAGVEIPVWASLVATGLAGYLSYRGFSWKELR